MSLKNNELSDSEARVVFGPFRLDLETRRLYKAGELTPLPARAADILALLARSQGRLVTREQIREAIWGEQHLDFDASLNTAIRSIRRALNDNATTPTFIETAPRRGYRFLQPVTFETNDAPEEPSQKRGLNRAVIAALGALVFVSISMAFLAWRTAPPATGTDESEAFRNAIQSDGYEDFLRGRHALSRGRLTEAEKYLTAALDADPGLAPAHVSLAMTHIRNRKDGWRRILLAEQHLSNAIKAYPNLAQAHALKGAVALYYFRDRDRARRHLDQAFAINPKNVDAMVKQAYLFVIEGDNVKALESIAKAHALNPLSPQLNADYGWIMYKAGNLLDAEKLCKTSVELNPESEFALSCVIHINHSQRDLAEVAEYGLILMSQRGADESDVVSIRNIPDATLRERAYWSWTLNWIESRPENTVTDPLSKKAIALTMLGCHDDAVNVLHEAYEKNGEPFLSFVAVDPRLYDLRSHYEFADLATKSRTVAPYSVNEH